jgi:predicted secreted protein
MSVTLGLAIYFIVWWVVLFCVLPFGVKTQEEAGEVVPGTPESAPAAVRVGRVAAITTGVATIVFGLVWAEIETKTLTRLINRFIFGA